MKNNLLYILIIAGLLTSCSSNKEPDTLKNTLFYTEPAKNWVEGLPIGNGRLGAMIYGPVMHEQLALNENTLYSGEPGTTYEIPNKEKEIEEVITLLRNKEYAKADAYVTKNLLGRIHQCYQPLGDLSFDFGNETDITNYKRELDISNAVSAITYTVNGVNYKREYFASFPDQVIVMHFSADKKGELNFNALLSSVHPNAKQSALDKNTIMLHGTVPGFVSRRTLEYIEQKGDQHKYPEIYTEDGIRKEFAKQILYGDEIDNKGISFDCRLMISDSDGELFCGDNGLELKNASYATLILSTGTSFSGFDKSPSREGIDPAIRAVSDLQKASKKSYKELKENHIIDYSSLFKRVDICIDENPEKERLPTDQRIKAFNENDDHNLAALCFQYGRYLMISGSRGNGQPLNLQGLWNKDIIPAWNSAYTININTEMNYWPTELTNLSECHQPLFRLIKEAAVNGQQVARNMYGNRGWVSHHNVDIWRHAGPIDNLAVYSYWPMSSGWFCSHLWEHYLFTKDIEFLKNEAYPIMKGAAEFYLDWLIENEKGYWVTPIATSPENGFTSPTGNWSSISMGSTMDMAIIKELFSRVLKAAQILELDEDFQQEISSKLTNLLPYKIGSKGQLQEWQYDFDEPEPQHRHLSHLYGFHPGDQITKDKTPELFEAVRRTLEIRGDYATGWSMGWKINLWARMQDGNHAYNIIRNFFTLIDGSTTKHSGGGIYKNLLCAHPPFQIDGNFGYTAGIAEMLLQSFEESTIRLLPALPDAWQTGYVTGLKARGNFEVDIYWENGMLTKAIIQAKSGGKTVLLYRGKRVELDLKKNEKYILKK